MRLLLGAAGRSVSRLLILATLLLAWDSPSQGDPLRLAAQPYQFSLLVWEAENLVRAAWPTPLPATPADGERVLTDYFQAARELQATRPGEQRREEAQAAHARLAPLAERIVADKIAQLLRGEGMGLDLPLGRPFPPVVFTFQQAPHFLIVSPRDRIELRESILLHQEMRLKEIEGLEGAVERGSVSALVERVGGVATFPTLITPRTSLASAVEAAVHEWVHTYLLFQPLGQGYWAAPGMATINETLADLVGAEVAGRLAPPPRNDGGGTPSASPSHPPFDAGAILRQTRLRVEELLAAGNVEEAERYMEEQRRFLAANGVYIRRLNQAYFAFHGTYASSPASISPIHRQLRALRARSPSLAAFLRQVAALRSVEELDALVPPDAATGPRSGSAASSSPLSPSRPEPG